MSRILSDPFVFPVIALVVACGLAIVFCVSMLVLYLFIERVFSPVMFRHGWWKRGFRYSRNHRAYPHRFFKH